MVVIYIITYFVFLYLFYFIILSSNLNLLLKYRHFIKLYVLISLLNVANDRFVSWNKRYFWGLKLYTNEIVFLKIIVIRIYFFWILFVFIFLFLYYFIIKITKVHLIIKVGFTFIIQINLGGINTIPIDVYFASSVKRPDKIILHLHTFSLDYFLQFLNVKRKVFLIL